MIYGSVCSGIEAASIAFEPLGWKPAFFSEIEKFPRAVLKHHWPDVPLHGDFTKLIDDPIDCDILVGGPPCQSFSIAGKRGSLSDDRGNLSLSFARLADAIDDLRQASGKREIWVLYENVPGILNTPDNAFGCFLAALVGDDTPIEAKWTDAGVVDGPRRCAAWRVLDAQHFGLAQRRRRVFVLAKGGSGRWACADALLPIVESVSWHPAPSREAGEAATASVANPLGRGLRQDLDSETYVPAITHAPKTQSNKQDPTKETFIAFGKGIHTTGHQGDRIFAGGDVFSTLSSQGGNNGGGAGGLALTANEVRRLTPTECERLQGFSGQHTLIPYRGKPANDCPDGPRYCAVGNSWAVPVVRYIGERIAEIEGAA